MKTNFLKIAIVLFLGLMSVNCSKDEDTIVYPEQNPLDLYLSESGFDQAKVDVINSSDYEFGLSFKPTVKGKINAIVAKIPDAQAGMRVTIWETTTKTILRTELVDVATAGVAVTKEITPLELDKDKEYTITYNGNDWYNRKKTDNSVVVYPFTAGDIQITGYGYASGALQVYPTAFPMNYYAGDVSFKFQRTE